MMPKYIKVKNGTGEGDLVLRTKLVLKVIDVGEGRAKISYGDDLSDAWELQTTSTAAEVLEAMEGKEQGCPVHFTLHRRDGNIDANPTITADWRHGAVIGEANFAPLSLDEYKKLLEYVFITHDTFPGLDHLINNSAAESPEGTAKRFVVRGGGKEWRVYNTIPLDGDDGCDGIFITREGAEEYAASRERETSTIKPPICTCGSFAGNADCPTHGIGTAWRDLHGE